MVSRPRHETTPDGPATATRIPDVLCGAPGVKTKILSTKKKGPGCKHRIEVSRRGVEKCSCLTSSLIGRVQWGCFNSYVADLFYAHALVKERTTFEGLIPFLDSRIFVLWNLRSGGHMTRNLAQLRNCEEIVKLLELASKEQDQDKMGALFEAILRYLQDKQRTLTASLLEGSCTTQQRQTLII